MCSCSIGLYGSSSLGSDRVPITPCRVSGGYFRGHRSVMTELENTSTSHWNQVPCWWSRHLLDSEAKASAPAFNNRLNILRAAHTALNVLSLRSPLASSFTSLLSHGDHSLLHRLTGVPDISPPPPDSAFFTVPGLASESIRIIGEHEGYSSIKVNTQPAFSWTKATKPLWNPHRSTSKCWRKTDSQSWGPLCKINH